MGSKGRPYRTVPFEGFDILVGRGENDNDHLTFDVAEPKDLWLHVGSGTPGSHVVIKNPNDVEIPESVIVRAASLAAWFSKARGSPNVDVHYCLAGDVSKPHGAPAGLVEIKRWKSIRVKPEGINH